MKTHLEITPNKTFKSFALWIGLLFATLAFTSVNAQSNNSNSSEVAQNQRTVKGMISDANGPLESVSVILKGTKIGTSTDSKGEFTFPQALKPGDVLLISYLGYAMEKAQIKEDTTYLNLTLTEELVEFVGALNTDKPYKSKRSN